ACAARHRETSMLFDRIDLHRLRRDVAACAAESRALKQVLRRTWTVPMADEQRRLARLAWRATELCILLARRRGRFHVSSLPPEEREEYHARIAERVARDYQLPANSPAATVAP